MRATNQIAQANQENQKNLLSIVLSDFWEEMFPKVDACIVPVMLKRIQFWVGEQPALTAAICHCITEQVSQASALSSIGAAATFGISKPEAEAMVDSVVQKNIIESWKTSSATDAVAQHFEEISTVLLGYDRRDSLLILYLQILQRDRVLANGSVEQAVLLRSGLITIRQGLLRVTVPIYAQIFDPNWIEQQLPGITKPVEIVAFPARSSSKMHRQLLGGFKPYSNLALGLCGLALVAVAVSAYLKESSRSALATAARTEAIEAKTIGLEANTLVTDQLSSPLNSQPDRVLFDEGIDHAQNSRWVLMMRNFCAIPVGSTYFSPAEKQLAQWITLYQEDIEIALNTVVQEQNKDCEMMNDLLKPLVE